jgi:hypothetical protein
MDHIADAKSAILAGLKKRMNDGVYIQLGHGAAGYAIVLTPLVFGATERHLLYGLIGVNVWALFKEFFIDTLFKDQPFRNSVEDYRNYLLGAVIASIVGLAAIARF